jgi:hypothetical protein
MNTPDPHWQPDPQLLAAFFDGELEGRNELADMRARIEAWLEAHPEAGADWARQRALQKLWLETTPAAPTEAAWHDTLKRIDLGRKAPRETAAGRHPWRWAGIAAACILMLIGAGYGVVRSLTPPEIAPLLVVAPPKDQPVPPKEAPIEVFEVATASEIVILRVEGADTSSLVVGVPPVVGPLELADAGEVRVIHVRPDARDKMVPNVRQDRPHRPMIWARLD